MHRKLAIKYKPALITSALIFLTSCTSYSSLRNVSASDNDTFNLKYKNLSDGRIAPLRNLSEMELVHLNTLEHSRDLYLREYRGARELHRENERYFLQLERALLYGDPNAEKYYTETLPSSNYLYIRRLRNFPESKISSKKMREIQSTFTELYNRRKSQLIQSIEDPISDHRVFSHTSDEHVEDVKVRVEGEDYY